MPPVDSTNGLACCPGSFSALRDQMAEFLPIQPPPVLSAGERCMMRLTRILMFPFFPLSILDQLPLHEVPSKMPRELSWKTLLGVRIHVFNRPVNLVGILRNKILPQRRLEVVP